MARTIAQIQAQIIANVEADATLSQLTSPSAVAIWRLWTYVVAVAMWTLETLFDVHKAEVQDALDSQKNYRLRYYVTKSLEFQYGSDLVEDQDYYDNSLLTPAQIEAQQIIAQAAAVEDTATNKVTVKVAKEVSGELEPLDTAEYDAFEAYVAEIKPAGVNVEILSFNADKIKVTVDVFYDPLVLNSTGARIDGTDSDPVGNAARAFLRTGMTFNGLFIVEKFRDALQAVDGVFVPMIRSVQATRFDNASFTVVDVTYQPYSGFLRFFNDADLTLNFIEQSLA